MVDLQLTAETASAVEVEALDTVIAPDDAVVQADGPRRVLGGAARRHERRHLLLPGLHALQQAAGWISPGGVNLLADRLQVPPAEVFGVASFYDLFRTDDPGPGGSVTHVCVDAACLLAGARDMVDRLAAEATAVEASPCLGQCERAPASFVQGRGEPDRVPADDDEGMVNHQHGHNGLRLMARVGQVDPTSLASYRDHGGFTALDRALDLGADRVIEAVSAAGLSGRGGAAFPTGTKWRAVADQPAGPKHVVANCDESEPGTFKDRVLLEHDPFALVEALTIAGLATGAEHGWIYIRGEYPRATRRLEAAIDQARGAGLLGADVAGHGLRFDIELRRGAGAYICGEETALFNSLEGYRGEPRNKPPFPTTHGLFGRPTAVNNPETLLNVLPIVLEGPDVYRAVGTDDSPGTRLFCLSGRVARPGVYELPFGTTLGQAVERAGGDREALRAVLLGGAAGMFVGPEHLDLPLTLEDTRAAGVTLGSGVIMVFDRSDDLAPVVARIAAFFRHESCGQCVPCRVGTVRQHEIVVDLQRRGTVPADRRRVLDDLAGVMSDASICGLGHTAAGAVRSAIDLGLLGAPS